MVDCAEKERDASIWYVDSGSTEHITNEKSLFNKLQRLPEQVTIAVVKEGDLITATHGGDIDVFSVPNMGPPVFITIKDVIFMEHARVNLLSVIKMVETGLQVIFQNNKVKILRGKNVIAEGKKNGKLYSVKFYRDSSKIFFGGRIEKDQELWHRRYGHISSKNLQTLQKNNLVLGLPVLNSVKNNCDTQVCEACVLGKQTKEPFAKRRSEQSSRPLEIIHSDVCGPMQEAGMNGERFFVTFIDDWSRFTMVFLIKTKNEVFDKFREYEAMVSKKCGIGISRLRCDNGGEYKNHRFMDYCKSKGIQMDFTVPYSPQQNGTSERMNRTLVEKARTMLEDSGVHKGLWGAAIQTAAYLINRSPTEAICKSTPYEMWNKRKPNVSNLRVFGSNVFVHIPKQFRNKFDGKAWRGIMIGYTTNGYRIWNPARREEVAARDVIFLEDKVRIGSSPVKEDSSEDISNNNHQNVEQFSEKENTESDYDSALDETVNVPEMADANESQICSNEKVSELPLVDAVENSDNVSREVNRPVGK